MSEEKMQDPSDQKYIQETEVEYLSLFKIR
jgi:hypothetical protein